MQLPDKQASVRNYRLYTAYTCRMLLRAGLSQPAQDARAALKRIRDAALAVEDAEEPYIEALADRDGADAALDVIPEEVSRTVGARAPDAKKKAPWTLIFPQAAEYYSASPVGEELKRYGELKERMALHLPTDDALRAHLPRLDELTQQWAAAQEAQLKASVGLQAKRAERDVAVDEWHRFMDRLYSALRGERGRAAAERFFKKLDRRAKRGSGEGDEISGENEV